MSKRKNPQMKTERDACCLSRIRERERGGGEREDAHPRKPPQSAVFQWTHKKKERETALDLRL